MANLTRMALARLTQFTLICAAFALTPAFACAENAGVADIDRLVSLPTLSGPPPSRPVWSPDGSRLAFLWNDSGFPFRDIYVTDASGGKPRQLTDLSPEASAQPTFGSHLGEDTSLQALEQASSRRHASGIGSMIWSMQGDSLYLRCSLRPGTVRAHELSTLAIPTTGTVCTHCLQTRGSADRPCSRGLPWPQLTAPRCHPQQRWLSSQSPVNSVKRPETNCLKVTDVY